MSVGVYSSTGRISGRVSPFSGLVGGRRWIVAAIGCAVMAASGVGLAGYLGLAPTTADAAQISPAPTPADAPAALD